MIINMRKKKVAVKFKISAIRSKMKFSIEFSELPSNHHTLRTVSLISFGSSCMYSTGQFLLVDSSTESKFFCLRSGDLTF